MRFIRLRDVFRTVAEVCKNVQSFDFVVKLCRVVVLLLDARFDLYRDINF